jgi:hypothetical protein
MYQNRMNEKSDTDLQILAPSIFTETYSPNRTEKYKQIKTIVIINLLRDNGWKPVFANTKRANKIDNKLYNKHLIAFKKQEGNNWLSIKDDLYPEIILTNSHDGTASYQIQAGLFRTVCANGLVVADSLFNAIKIKHIGFDPEKVIDASYSVIDNIPRLTQSVDRFSSIELSDTEQRTYAMSALIAKHNPETQEEIKTLRPESVLMSRRSEDNKNDLWTTFNRVQENLLKGKRHEIVGGSKSREIKSIDKNIALNKALWTLTEKMAELKLSA